MVQVLVVRVDKEVVIRVVVRVGIGVVSYEAVTPVCRSCDIPV